MAIRLQLLTEDPREIEWVERYWAMDESGQFLEKVSALNDVMDMPRGVTLAGFVRQRCRAFDENQVCPQCGELVEIRIRSEAKKAALRSTRLCTRCQEERDAIALEAEKAKMAELERRLATYRHGQLCRVVDYTEVPDAQVLLLLALDRAVTPRLANGGFTLGDCRGLAPQYVSEFVSQLSEAGLIFMDPDKAKPGTYYWRDDEIWFNSAQVVYCLAPNTIDGRWEEVIRTLAQRVYTDAEGLFGLWLDYSVADVMGYLGDQCELYNHVLAEQEWDEIKSTLRSALQTYSVAQLWSVVWKVVKDAASLANREYYNRQKAAATIPGKIRRHLEKVQRESIELKSWNRPECQPVGTLGMLLGELFDIDECASGLTAVSRIAKWTGKACSASAEAELYTPIRELMTDALALDVGASVMLRFADLIRAGHDVRFAVEEIGGSLRG
ncbi:hypothetical protein [Pseudomonas marginalis]|uniref:hypothetical protein n=1 Tax=Pseudomonas marginalis TaxID=298 RepID=UPI0034D48CF6